MLLRRTANAGVLMELDGVKILLDGVCRQTHGYFGTAPSDVELLYACPPDLVAFTHAHLDHFDRVFAQKFYDKTLRSVLGPEGLLKKGSSCEKTWVGDISVTPISSRHIGKSGLNTPHVSFLIEGSQRVLFTGDAAPSLFRNERVDVLIAPYAYVVTASAWRMVSSMTDNIVLVHMPLKEFDTQGLWHSMEEVTAVGGPKLWIPDMGQSIQI